MGVGLAAAEEVGKERKATDRTHILGTKIPLLQQLLCVADQRYIQL